MDDDVRIVASPDNGPHPPRTRLSVLAGVEPWRPRPLAPGADGRARVALVQSRAALLRGDAVSMRVAVQPGAALELVELGATIAHAVRGGPGAVLTVEISVGDGGRLVWNSQPVVAAAGCCLTGATLAVLEGSGRLLRTESLVFGRAGEDTGAASMHLRVTHDGRPLLDETLATTPRWRLRSDVVAGRAELVTTVMLAGRRDLDPPPGSTQAHGPATVWRGCGSAATVLAGSEGVARRWQQLIMDPAPAGSEGRQPAGV